MTSAPARPEPVDCIILGESGVRLWGLTGTVRLERQLRALGVRQIIRAEDARSNAQIVLVRADYLFDERTLQGLVGKSSTFICVAGDNGRNAAVAANVRGEQAVLARSVLQGDTETQALPSVAVRTPATLSSAYVGKLLKSVQPLLLPIRADQAAALERHLFDGSYKGVTDLVTKWVWPMPARWATKLCTRLGIGPNAVTTMSLLLALLAMVLFAQGRFGLGLAVAWIMTFLDTVDGKLARVTVTSTEFGHFFDHVIDVFHPPLWYLAWGYGLLRDPAELATLIPLLIAILGGYLAGRLIEVAFKKVLTGFSLFIWRPFDSYFRLITARRNLNLLLLTACTLAGLPKQGLIAVAVWTVLSTGILAVRLGQALYARMRHGRLRSWLEGLGSDLRSVPAYARPFTPDPAALARLPR